MQENNKSKNPKFENPDGSFTEIPPGFVKKVEPNGFIKAVPIKKIEKPEPLDTKKFGET